MTQVAVLGCGPAGLLAAHAAEIMGCQVTIISSKQKSHIGGAQYLHRSIPRIIDEKLGMPLHFHKWGECSVYASKVYGDPMAHTSWRDYPAGETRVWSMAETYDRLWMLFRDRIRDKVITPQVIDRILESASFDLVISSIPAKALCYDQNHSFESADVYIVQDDVIPVGQGPAIKLEDIPNLRDHSSLTRSRRPGARARHADNFIVMSGREHDQWYRASNIFGHSFLEYPSTVEQPRNAIHVKKPIHTDCDCWGEIMRVGRYGRWEKFVLAHHAYENTVDALNAL